MTDLDTAAEPDWDAPLQLTLTPAGVIHALFHNASTVHTAWSSCVDPSLVVSDLVAMDDAGVNYCRLVEQEYLEDGNEEVVWHDWLVEVRLGEVLIAGHWQLQVTAPPLDWRWAGREAEKAFEKACLLCAKRVRRGLTVEEPPAKVASAPERTRHH